MKPHKFAIFLTLGYSIMPPVQAYWKPGDLFGGQMGQTYNRAAGGTR